MGMTAWDVFRADEHGQERIDTVFYQPGIPAQQVHRDLVGHDGYPSDIIVRNASLRKEVEQYDSIDEFVYQNELDFDEFIAEYIHPDGDGLWD